MDVELQFAEPGRWERRAGARDPRHARLFGMAQRGIRFQQLDRQLAPFRKQLVNQRRQLWEKRVSPLG